ncbi:chloride channel protein [Amycolatopsis sp.]|uniref:chloride channel protein n=1 Tax=Amycolatopsis sp. TaxID=37632 RepID=UPI002CCBD09C|nr:chloride channel protein [Amycolatopsis sp.]HVV09501.1 chloride channel protein [Amycolatopsis sp.]
MGARTGRADHRRRRGLVLPGAAPGFWAICGLAAVVGGVMRSPLTGFVFTRELTHARVLPPAAGGGEGGRSRRPRHCAGHRHAGAAAARPAS